MAALPDNRRLFVALLLAANLIPVACTRSHSERILEAAVSNSALGTTTAPPLDHLAPGELKASSTMAFGFPIPSSMSIERAFPNAIHLTGVADVQGLVSYVRRHSDARSVELRGNNIVLDFVRIPAAGNDRTFRFEISAQSRNARLLIKETTLAAAPPEPGITDAERWRRAGMKPNGEPLDVAQLQ